MFRSVAYRTLLIVPIITCGVAGLEACSSSDDNRGGGGTAASGAAGGGAGGTSGAGAGSGGTAGLSGAGAGAGAGAMGPYMCAKGNKANCDSWTTFSQATTTSWGSSVFQGGVTTFGAKLVRDTSTSAAIHVSGTVDNYGYGFGLFFLNCSDLSAYTGVSFKLSGMAGSANMMIFQVQTNPDYPWQAMPADKKGGCTAAVATDPFGTCVAPSKTLAIADSTVLWTDLAGGKPTSMASPDQALGLQWALPYDGKTSYAFDVTVSDVKLVGGTGTSVSCDIAASGGAGGAASGGAGGTSAGAGGSAGSSAGTAGSGG